MPFDFDPLTPEEFDGDLTSAPGVRPAGLDDAGMPEEHTIPKFGDLSDLNRHDLRLVDDFLAALG
ncbi:hypothetical protein [Nocardia sp. NPDC127526]|uniref:hypothetical protein n=1 Tax=Nocardia sp. NPDC127526 TaxID=3345393 RepID=UPI00363B2F6F